MKIKDITSELSRREARIKQLENDLEKETREYHEYALKALNLNTSKDGLTINTILKIFCKAQELSDE